MADKDHLPVVPLDDDVTSFVVDEARLQTFKDASEQLSHFQVPRLVGVGNPHEKIFYAFFDGTGNNADKDPLHATNVDWLRKQIESLQATDKQISSHYVAGVGTQDQKLTQALDGALGHTYEARMEEMYWNLADKAEAWSRADPNVQVRVCSVGFSRGATQCAIFTNLLDQRGILDPTSEVIDAEGRSRYTRHIAAPGKTPQAVGLFDPVSTGVQELADRRLAPSVVSGFQITALDERRVKFVSDRIMPLGLSEDGRFLNVTTAGAHSNIGGGYLRDGLSTRSLNLMSDYLNAQRPDAPMFQKVHESHDPRLNRVHNSHEGMAIYQLDRKVDRATPEGVNTRLAPESPVTAGQVAQQNALPHGPKHFDDQIVRGPSTPVRIGPIPEQPGSSPTGNIERIAAAEAAGIGPLSGEQKLANLAHRFAGGALGVGATVYEGVQTARRASELMEQGNTAAAQSEINHAAARNAGGWIGGVTATYAASAVGASGFVPAAIVVGDALLMSKAFDKVVDLKENREIFHQVDKAGVAWQFNGRDWERQAAFDRTTDGHNNPAQEAVGASYVKSRELGAMANAVAVKLALGKAPPPQDPFNLPASPDDQIGLDNQSWHRNPETEGWERLVKTGVTGPNDSGTYAPQTASPEQTRRLNQEALGRIESNIANGREALAQTYLESRAAQRGQDYDVGISAAVEFAKAKPDQVQGHDGLTYQRSPEGQWSSKNGPATGNLAMELELTNQIRQPSLERAQQTLAALEARSAPTPEQLEHNDLLQRYRNVGVDLNAQESNLQAIALATQRTRDAAGITGQTMQQLQRSETGQYGFDTPIVHYQTGADGVAHQVAVTTSEELRQARAEVRQAHVEVSTPTLATVKVTAPKLDQPAKEQDPALAQDDHAQRQAHASQAGAPITPEVQHDHAHALLQERESERQKAQQPERTTANPPNPQVSFLNPDHAGHQRYKTLLNEVHRMEVGQGIEPGPHSEKIAAALLIEGVAKGLYPHRVKMGADGQVEGIQQFNAFVEPQSVRIDPKQAQGLSMQQYAEKMEATLSSHLVSHAPTVERTSEQKQGIAAMSMNDQILFAHLRRGTPGHISDDHVAQAMLGAKDVGITDPSKIGNMTMAGDNLSIRGTQEGQRVMSDVSQPAPPLQETAQQVLAFNQQRDEQLALDQQRNQQQEGQKGPVM
ncbi:DUF2235 domain-containing protein [Pseudoxanthomonas sp.]|uniref:phospholipase effector Tle1 domain-containing protein n=1 Tax=Pseudoxanthomonas sp. TaxID=1871049 RepID=UPI00261884C4|nr:DUF2235 domain-containing protein [Pseudoxanthomonas sp.]WDS37781.1 MAG: DUF2235 domain-containing protein [Pseudoxanthomonas sp.]